VSESTSLRLRRGLAQAQGSELGEVAVCALAGLVQQGDGLAGEELPVTAGEPEAVA
jgi:hypothetical protein